MCKERRWFLYMSNELRRICVEFAMCCAAFAMICVEFALIRYILYFYNNCKKVYYNIEFEITVNVYLFDNCDAAMCQS